MGITTEDIFSKPVRLVPSANILFPNGKPVTYSLITDDYIALAHDLHQVVAERFAKLHNASLQPL